MYRVRDSKYANRWVELGDHIVKFWEQEALVPDRYINQFKTNPEYQIIEHVSVDDPPRVEKKGARQKK